MEANANVNTDTVLEEKDQAENNYFLLEAPIAELAEHAGVDIDEAVNIRVAAARCTPDLSGIDVNVRLLNQPQGKLLGLATVEYHGFKMEGFKVFNGENGLFLGEPTTKYGRSNNYVKTIFVKGDELREALNKKAFEGYNVAVEKLNVRAAEAKKVEVRPSMKEQLENGAKQAAEHNAAQHSRGKSGRGKAAEL